MRLGVNKFFCSRLDAADLCLLHTEPFVFCILCECTDSVRKCVKMSEFRPSERLRRGRELHELQRIVTGVVF